MTLTPQDIQSQQFHVRFRGFDAEEVDAFLERVAEEFLLLQEEHRQLTEEVQTLKGEVSNFQSQERAFQKAILAAQKIVDEMKEKSRLEAEQLLEQARREAQDLQEEANREVAQLERELDRLTGMKGQAKRELQQILESYLARLDEEPETQAEEPQPTAEELSVLTGETGMTETAPEEPPAWGEQKEFEATGPAAGEQASTEEAAPAAAAAREEETPVVDLSDLYEKIELPESNENEDELETSSQLAAAAADDDETDVRDLFQGDAFGTMAEEEEEGDGSSIPDLEGDMLFTLEDPLDKEEPADFGESKDDEAPNKEQSS